MDIHELGKEFFAAAEEMAVKTQPLGAFLVACGFMAIGMKTIRQGTLSPGALFGLLVKTILIAAVTIRIGDWLAGYQAGIKEFAYGELKADPSKTWERYQLLMEGRAVGGSEEERSVWDKLWNADIAVGEAIVSGILWVIGWIAYFIHWCITVLQSILIAAGLAFAPVMVGMFMINAQTARSYLMGLISLATWPLGWAVASLFTAGLLDVGIKAFGIGNASTLALSSLFLLLIAVWIIISSITAPLVITKMLTSGANAASSLLSSTAGAIAGGAGTAGAVMGGAGLTAATAGAAAPVAAAGVSGTAGAGAAAGSGSAAAAGAAGSSAGVVSAGTSGAAGSTAAPGLPVGGAPSAGAGGSAAALKSPAPAAGSAPSSPSGSSPSGGASGGDGADAGSGEAGGADEGSSGGEALRQTTGRARGGRSGAGAGVAAAAFALGSVAHAAGFGSEADSIARGVAAGMRNGSGSSEGGTEDTEPPEPSVEADRIAARQSGKGKTAATPVAALT